MRHMADNEENTFIAILSKTKLSKNFVMTGVLCIVFGSSCYKATIYNPLK